jgi:hypothetical protein
MRRACLILCSLLVFAAVPALADDLSGLLPETAGGLKRVQLITGAEAQAEVDRLHGKALTAEASAIARYAQDGGRPAEVWVSRVATEKEARRQTGLMVHKMFENPKSPFKDPKRLEHNGLAVYRFSGMGQTHLIWHSGDLVWWVSVAPDKAQPLLDAFCR